MKIQPIDFTSPEGSSAPRYEPVKPIIKSRFKRLFERQFSSVLKISAPEKSTGTIAGGGESHFGKEICDDFELSSVCLDKMVENFIYESGDNKQRCGRQRCKCLRGNGTDSSDDEADSVNCFGESNHTSCPDACDSLKSLVPCACVSERNLLADIAKIVEKNKIGKRKDHFCRKIVTDDLLTLGYDASICESRWEKSSSFPAGEYEYVDVLFEGDRLIIDIDFRSEFEIARSTKAYKLILQVLPIIFVGKADRLQRIVSIVSEAAKQSLKKKGMPCPPWRKAEYVMAKWLSPYTRATPKLTPMPSAMDSHERDVKVEREDPLNLKEGSGREFELTIGEKISRVETNDCAGENEEKSLMVAKQWKPPETKPKSSQIGVKILAGLASVIEG
ncbi:uncharacterized protein [Coffea arabica]|uniref:Uncharacterized protein n=1 Tax=Coffea arabica TaxID=13443 RepID=A0A6P6WJT3_COFAR|nr:uncharacterized protein LOC113732937 [Coffea arabica]